MGKIVIKKRITLEFLGDEYKEAYITFKTISLSEADALANNAIKASEEKRSNDYLRDLLESLFIDGKFPDEKGEMFDISKEDIKDIDLETSTKIFDILTGQYQSPKV